MNLISNAIKYSPQADKVIVGVAMENVMGNAIENGVLKLSVRDFGIGMPPEIRKKIFERFYRSDDPAASSHPGLGLGLYISNEIVRQHGGSISVEGEKGVGMVFTVLLPLKTRPEGAIP